MSAAGTAATAPVTKVGGLPVRATAVGADASTAVRLEVLDSAKGRQAGLPVVLAVRRTDGKAGGKVHLDIDYSGFRDAYGGDWSSRLRLVRVPACAAATPTAAACLQRTEVPSQNSPPAGVVSADVDLAGGDSVVALAAGGESETGSFAKTSFSQTYHWQAGQSSGAFSWSYPMRVPPAAGGPVPDVTLAYNSASVDGRTNAEAAQNSWIGEGWDYAPGYIERTYRPCNDDNDNNPHYPNNTTGDLCWRDYNATLVWGGRSTELILDDATSKWHLAQDDGSMVSKYGGSTSVVETGLWNDENWKITTPDGTEYWFGRTRLPGWTTGARETGSIWGTPVVSNHSNEPCFSNVSYLSSICSMAWRWNLDYVVDRNGNSMSYWYTRDRARTGVGGSIGDTRIYDRGGWLDRIEYGTRAGIAEFAVRGDIAAGDPVNAARWIGRFERLGPSCRFVTYFNGGTGGLEQNDGLLVPAYQHLFDRFN